MSIHSSMAIPKWSPLLVSNMLTVTILSVSSCWVEATETCCFLWSSCAKPFSFILCVGLNNICWSGQLRERHSHPFDKLRENNWHHQLIHSALDSCLPKTKATLWSPSYREEVSFLCNSCSNSHSKLVPDLHGHNVLAFLLWTFFCCRGLLIRHKVKYAWKIFWPFLAPSPDIQQLPKVKM